MVIVEDENPERLEIAAQMGDAPLATEKGPRPVVFP
jgi:hypothetical protein